MSVIDWLYEVMNKKKITDRSVTFQAIELMDLYYQHCEQGKELADLQLTAVMAFFVAAKNIMVEPFGLEEARVVLCYEKYTME